MDTLTPDARSRHMARIRAKDSRPEMIVRKAAHAMGYRYRLHDGRLPGSPDLVFRRRRAVVFVHGCFWHQHPDPACGKARVPKSRPEFWIPKFEANRARDARVLEALERDGWRCLVVWECECGQSERLRSRLRAFLEGGVDDDAGD